MEPNQSYGKRLWYLWGPIVIKFGISYLVYVIVLAALMVVYTSVQSGGDPDAMMSILESNAQTQQMYDTLMEQLVNISVPVEGIAALITIPIMLILFHKDRVKAKQIESLLHKAPLWKYIGVIAIAGTMSLALNNLILIGNLSELSASYEETMKNMYEPSLPMQIICLGILIPVCEELVYRGLMYKRLRIQLKFSHAALYSSIVFAITHGNIVQMLYGFAMGMLLAYVYEKYGSVKAPIAGHVTANLLSILGTYFHLYEWLIADPMRMGVVTVACAAIASSVYVWMQRMEPQENPSL